MSRPGRSGHRGHVPSHHNFSRMARVNEVLREVLADAIERAAGNDARLELATVTAVRCDADLRHATVLLASMPAPVGEALAEARPRLQAAIAHEVRMKRTPLLSFEADPTLAYAERVEVVLRRLGLGSERPQGPPGGAEETRGRGG
jgi:ribosome-binding factor A